MVSSHAASAKTPATSLEIISHVPSSRQQLGLYWRRMFLIFLFNLNQDTSYTKYQGTPLEVIHFDFHWCLTWLLIIFILRFTTRLRAHHYACWCHASSTIAGSSCTTPFATQQSRKQSMSMARRWIISGSGTILILISFGFLVSWMATNTYPSHVHRTCGVRCEWVWICNARHPLGTTEISWSKMSANVAAYWHNWICVCLCVK